MQIENDYDREVYNGDLGIVSCIDMEEGEITVDFERREAVYGFGELDDWCSPMRRQSTKVRAPNILP
jgi:exodeoxyribonuclease V alpha subunit